MASRRRPNSAMLALCSHLPGIKLSALREIARRTSLSDKMVL